MEDGTYRITRAFGPLKPDKRVKHDWRALPIDEGELFSVTTIRDWAGEHKHTRQVIRPAYCRWASIQNMPIDAIPADALERIEETPELWLRRTDNANWALETLDELVESGVCTMDQVQRAFQRAYDKAR